MLHSIIQASQNFCNTQIGLDCEINSNLNNKKMINSYIDIETNNAKKYRVYISSDFNFAQRISKIFLEEELSDEQTLIDMALETTNLIVGSAKVIAEELNTNPYSIKTPFLDNIGIFSKEYDDIKTFKIENDEMIIAIKELD